MQPDKLLEMLYGDPDDDIPYFAALGKFIAGYASAETSLHMLARKLSGLSDIKARIVFNGMRLKEIRERVLALMRLDEDYKKQYDEVEECLTQLDKISTERHKLVHRHVTYHKKRIHVTNVFTSKSLSQEENDEFSLTDINNMEADCSTIFVRLEVVRRPNILGNAPPDTVELLYSAWQYKPSRQHSHKKRQPKNTQK